MQPIRAVREYTYCAVPIAILESDIIVTLLFTLHGISICYLS